MSGPYRAAAAAIVALALAGPSGAVAQEAAEQAVEQISGQAGAVVATVNGEDITSGEVAIAAEDLGTDLERIPEQLRATILVDILINQRLLAARALEEGVDESDAFKRRLEYFRLQSLRDAYVETDMLEAITEEDVQERYDAEISELPVEEEIRARHILVDSEGKAATLVRLARDSGVDFANLASANSDGPSASRGGDLGYFTAEQMFDEFSKAAFALEVGEISDPVETQAGWHVIKLEDRRNRPPPPLESVFDQIKALVLRDSIRSLTAELREGAEIEFAQDEALPGAPADSEEAGESEAPGPEESGEPEVPDSDVPESEATEEEPEEPAEAQ